MEFEWDEDKRLANIAKHRIDFLRAQRLFDKEVLYQERSDRFDEERFATTGMLEGTIVTAVCTWRGSARRFISVRRARDADQRAYRELLKGRIEAMIARGEDMTDWTYVDSLTEEELEASIDDEEEGGPFDHERGLAKPDRPRPDSIGIDDDVHEWFKGEHDHVSLMNTILRRWMVAHPRSDEVEIVDVRVPEPNRAGEAA